MQRQRVQLTITSVALLVALAHLIWPGLSIDGITVGLLLMAAVPWLAPLFKTIELPGGFKAEFQDLTSAGQRAEQAGLLADPEEAAMAPAFSFESVANEDPKLALAGLRIELERALSVLAEKNGILVDRASVGRLLHELNQNGLLNRQESSVLSDVVELLNAAVHGREVDSRAAEWALDEGKRILVRLLARA